METKIISSDSVRYRASMPTGTREVIISFGPGEDVRVQSSHISAEGFPRPTSIFLHEIEGFVCDARQKLQTQAPSSG